MDKIVMSNTTLVVSLRCNLRCKLCAVSAPYYKQPPHYSLELLKKTVDRYFQVIDYVEKFTVNGGEPFIHPEIAEIMEHILKYEDQIGMLEIISNSSVLPGKNLINILKSSSKIDILLDDYGDSLSKSINNIVGIFDKEGIKYRRRKYYGENSHLGGWVDLRDISRKERTSEETRKIYEGCAYPGPFHCFALFGGKAYICGVYVRCKHENIIPDNPGEYIDFVSDSWNVEETKSKIKIFYDRKYFSACEFCNGFCMNSERFIPAEQI